VNFNLFFQTVLSGLISGAIYGVLGMGFVVTYKATRVLNLAHGGMAMFLAFVTLACLHQHWNYGLALAVTAVAAIAMGIAIDLSIMRPLRNRPPLDSAVASLGLLLTLQGLAVIIFGAQEKVFPAAVPLRFVKVAGFNFSYPQLLAFGCVAVSAAIVGMVFRWTRAGLAIRAYVENPDSARGLGVSPRYVSTIAWSLAALLAAVAGVMLAPLTLLDSLRMPLFSVKALVAALLGGLTSLSGALMGGLLLGVAEAYFQGYVHFRDSVNYLPFGLVVLALLYQGFRGTTRTATRAA
jgi:branched-subunit amino acid ABC-type transport system permease component